jgi:hypothetical protein
VKNNVKLGVKLKCKAIFFLLIFILICPAAANAFYHMEKHTDEIQIENSSMISPAQDNNIFQFYDNFSYPATNEYLIKKVPGFVSMSQIEITMPLKILSIHPVSMEDSIDRMLLANLKINQLIAQYTQLQEKAKSLVKNYSKISRDQNAVSGNIEKGKQAIIQQILNWNKIKITNIEDISPLSTILEERNVSTTKNSNAKKKAPQSEFQPATENPTVFKEIKMNSGQRQVFGTRNSSASVPWVLSVLMDIIKYVSTNRLEILFYLVFFSLIIGLIRLQVKQ